jgi:hypothetical protein
VVSVTLFILKLTPHHQPDTTVLDSVLDDNLMILAAIVIAGLCGVAGVLMIMLRLCAPALGCLFGRHQQNKADRLDLMVNAPNPVYDGVKGDAEAPLIESVMPMILAWKNLTFTAPSRTEGAQAKRIFQNSVGVGSLFVCI